MIGVPYIDTHCHLDLVNGIQKLAAAEDATGIKSITVTNSPMFYLPNVNLFRGSKNIRVALGMHPELAMKQQPNIPMMSELIADARFIGEIGLDGSSDFSEGYATQVLNFESILREISLHKDKILTVHTRNAAKQTINYLRRYLSETNCKVILHWFSGSVEELNQALMYGFYFSVNHKMLRSRKALTLLKGIPIDRILTETDAPFTFDAVINTRIKSLDLTIAGLANLYGLGDLEMRQVVYENFNRILT